MRILTEDEVIDAVIGFLRGEGWEISSRATAKAKQRGYDIEATRGTERLIVEAKGAGSSIDGSPRHGHEFDRTQVFDHVAKAILKALRVVAGHSGRAAVAFPDNKNHREEVKQVHEALMTLGIIIFWVSVDGIVRVDGL
ncbi:MAG: hypothetical protein HY893_02730 [Deltaproteobacteria bacterium]|nr:hypothetical protein [Deltaproteobacteria bacterium]